MSRWDLQLPGPAGLAISSVFVLFVLVLCIVSLQRSHLGKHRFVLQLLRALLLLLVGFTLLRPEKITEQRIDQKPELAILLDDTGSMSTMDVTAGQGIISRKTWLDEKVKAEFWKSLEKKYVIHQDRISVHSRGADDEPAGTDLNQALNAMAEQHNNLRAILILSDGDWNMGGSPLNAATRLHARQVHVYPVLVGSEQYLPDIELVDVRSQAFCILGEKAVIPVRIQSRINRTIRTKLKLSSNRTSPVEKDIVIPPGQAINEQILWPATVEGEHELKIEIPLEKDEKIKNNNGRSFRIGVRRELLKVLIVESYPRWEFRFLRNALMRDPGVDVNCLLLHPQLKVGGGQNYIRTFPAGRDEISKYDVVFLGDVGLGDGELTKEQLGLIKGIVERQGSGLVFLPGIRGRLQTLPKTPVGDMLPVILDGSASKGTSSRSPAKLLLTRLGSDHLLTMLANSPGSNRLLWKSLPGFYWNAGVLRAKAGSDVLAIHSSQRNQWGRIPLLVTLPYGNGNVLFMGTDSAWRWRRGVEDTYHYRFWGQVVRWMAHPRHLSHTEGIRFFYTPENPKQGDTVFFQATIFDKNGFPLTKGKPKARLHTPKGKQQDLLLTPIEGGWGVYSGSFIAEHAGSFEVGIQAQEVGHDLTTAIHVATKTRERTGTPARAGSLRDIARRTQGSFAHAKDLESVIAQIQALPKEEVRVHRFPLWSQWWWGCMILSIFVAYWVLRKMWGLL